MVKNWLWLHTASKWQNEGPKPNSKELIVCPRTAPPSPHRPQPTPPLLRPLPNTHTAQSSLWIWWHADHWHNCECSEIFFEFYSYVFPHKDQTQKENLWQDILEEKDQWSQYSLTLPLQNFHFDLCPNPSSNLPHLGWYSMWGKNVGLVSYLGISPASLTSCWGLGKFI